MTVINVFILIIHLSQNCYRENKAIKPSAWKSPKVYEPLAHDPASEESESEEFMMTEGNISVTNYTHVSFKPLTPPISPPSSIPGPKSVYYLFCPVFCPLNVFCFICERGSNREI